MYTYLRSVAHVGRELYEATVALKVFRVPGLIHGSHAILTLTEYLLTIINGFTNILNSLKYVTFLNLCKLSQNHAANLIKTKDQGPIALGLAENSYFFMYVLL